MNKYWETAVHPMVPVIYHDSGILNVKILKVFFHLSNTENQLHYLVLAEDEKIDWEIRFDFKFDTLKCISVWAFAKVFTYSQQKQN